MKKITRLIATLAAAAILSTTFASSALAFSGWEKVFSGYGEVDIRGNNVYLEPMTSTDEDETHAALVVNDRFYNAKDYVFLTGVRLYDQLREGSEPNTWETPWVMFRYTDLENYYYFILKTNGIELGKKQGSDDQIFLVTESTPKIAEGDNAFIKIKCVKDRIMIWVNGELVIDYTDPDPILQGTVGLYSEDAAVKFLKPRLLLRRERKK